MAGLSDCPWALVAVVWVDAFDSENGWIEVAKYRPETAHVVTVGWLWPDCLEGYLSLTASYMPDEVRDGETPQTVGMVTHIPLGMVVRVITLRSSLLDVVVEDRAASVV